jgi:hypothetical protein
MCCHLHQKENIMKTYTYSKKINRLVFFLLLIPLIGLSQNTSNIDALSISRYSNLDQIPKINNATTLKRFQDLKRGVARLCYGNSNFNCINGFLLNTTDNSHNRNRPVSELFFLTQNLSQIHSGDKVYLSFDFELPNTDAGDNDMTAFSVNRMYEVEIGETIATNSNTELYRITFNETEEGDNYNLSLKQNDAFYNAYVLGWDIGDGSIYDQYLSNISHFSSGLGNSKSSYKRIFQNYDGAEINTKSLREGSFLVLPTDWENMNTGIADLYNILSSPLLNEGGGAVAYSGAYPHRYTTLKSRWLSYWVDENLIDRTYKPNLIDYLESDRDNRTWMNKVSGGYANDLVPNPVNASFDLTVNSPKSKPISIVASDFFPFQPRAAHLNKYNSIEQYYGDGINAGPTNPSQSDVLVYITPNDRPTIVLYGKQLVPLSSGFLNGTTTFQGKHFLVGENPHNIANFPNERYHFLDLPRQSDKMQNNLFDFLRQQNNGGNRVDLLSTFDFPATIHMNSKSGSPTASIRGIRLPHKLPVNAKELFEDNAYANLWQSYKYKESKYSTQIGNNHLHIESVEIITWDQPENVRNEVAGNPQHPLYPINPISSKKITTGDNGGYLNLDNLAYKFETNPSLELLNDAGLPNDVDSKDSYLEIVITLDKNFEDAVAGRAWIDFFNRDEVGGKKVETTGSQTRYSYNFEDDPVAHPIEKIGESQNLYSTDDFNIIRINGKMPVFGIDDSTAKLGRKRLRISVKRGAGYPQQDSFNENVLGEVEDYLIDVQLAPDPTVNNDLVERATISAYAKIHQNGSTGTQANQNDTDPSCSAGSASALDALLYDSNGEEDNRGVQRTCSEWVGPCVSNGNCGNRFATDNNAIGNEVIKFNGNHYANLDTQNLYTTGDFTTGFSVYTKFKPNNPLTSGSAQYLYAMGNVEGNGANDGWGMRYIPDNENAAIELIVNANSVVQTYKIPVSTWLEADSNIWIECLVVKDKNKLIAVVKNHSTAQLKREIITLYNEAMNITGATTLGGVASSTYKDFNGRMDRLIFWDAPLNERDQDIFMDAENSILPTDAEICDAIADKTLISIENTNADRFNSETPPIGADPNNPPANPTEHQLALQNGEYVPQGANTWEGYYINSLFQDTNPIPDENEVTVLQVPKSYMMSGEYVSLGGSSFPNPEGGDDDDDFDNDPANNYVPLIPRPSDNLGFDPQNPGAWNYWDELDQLNSELQQLIREWRRVSSTAEVNFLITADDEDRRIFKAFANHINTFSGALNIVRNKGKLSDYVYLLYSWDQQYGILNSIPQVNTYRTLLKYAVNYHGFFDQLAECYQLGECEIDLTDNLTTIALDWFGVILPESVTKRVINTLFTLTGLPDVGKVAIVYQSKGPNNEVTVGIKHDGSLYFETKLNNIVRDIQSAIKIPLNQEIEISTTFNNGVMTASIGGEPIQDTDIHPVKDISYSNFTNDENGSNVGGPVDDSSTNEVAANVKIARIVVLNETMSLLENLNFTNCSSNTSSSRQTSRTAYSAENNETEQEIKEDSPVQPDFNIYPNPATDHLKILVEVAQSGPLQINIFDMNGRVVYEKLASTIDKGHQLIELNNLRLSLGHYIVRIQAGNVQRTERLVIEK